MNRRDFIVGALCAGSGGAGCSSLRMADGQDENLSVFISDLHVGGANKKLAYTGPQLERVVDEILAMRPLPKRVICFGDIAMSFGLPVDYAASKPILKRIEAAGIELHMTMGNHDRRAAFFKEWPEYLDRQVVPGRCTRVVDLGHADLVLLDALKGTDDRGLDSMGPVDGLIDGEQLKWLKGWMSHAKRPFFLGSHQFRDLTIEGISRPLRILEGVKHAVGWIYGHDHAWCPDIGVASWKKHSILPTLALPSTGLWGDIGYVVFRTDEDGATAELVQSDFYFQTPTSHAVRPRFWTSRVRENQGKSTRFVFEKGC